MEEILCTIDDGIARVELNRPAKKNAVTLDMLDQLAQIGQTLESEKTLRGVLISGAGGDLSSGLDLSTMQSLLPQLGEIKSQMLNPGDPKKGNRFQRPCLVWRDLPVPVVAAIDGVCFGAGLQLALGADLRIATPSSQFSVMESKWGLIPDMGISVTLPPLMGADKAKDLMFTARVLQADEALSLGLITWVEEAAKDTALAYLNNLKGVSPEALSGAKALVDTAWTNGGIEGLNLEAQLQADLLGSLNQIESVMSRMAKRPPKFT